MKELVKLLEKANKAYREGNPIISDAEYDAYIEELKNLDPNHPYLNKVEEESFEKPKIKHTEPMLSIEKVFSVEDLGKWFKRIEKNYNDVAYKITPKLDGMAAKYENGTLSTRGDGYEGFDITDAIKKGLVVEQGNHPLGEIVMNKDYFNENLSEKYAHPRNVVVGAIKCDKLSKDQEVSMKAGAIKFIAYDELPLFIGRSEAIIKNLSEIIQDLTEKTPYPIDGFVISVVNSDIRKELGNTNHHYRWNVAYKEQTDIKQTRVYSISWQVGRNNITPVLEVDPVEVSGCIIKRVTGHNYGYLHSKGIGVGSTIEIIRSGEVIPKVVNVLIRMETEYCFHCPVCGEETILVNNTIKCVNSNCGGQIQSKLNHFFKTLKVDYFGKKSIERLVNNGYISPVDILNMSKQEFIECGFGTGQSKNLVNSLNYLLKTPVELYKLLSGISIPLLGESEAKKLLNHYSLEDLLYVTPDELLKLEGFGEIKSNTIYKGIVSNRKLIEQLIIIFGDKEYIEEGHRGNNMLNRQSFVFTGTMSQKRDNLFNLCKENGGIPQNSITKNTNFLVMGERVGKSKTQKAEKLNIQMITENDFMNMIN